jgi:hypothetical protein
MYYLHCSNYPGCDFICASSGLMELNRYHCQCQDSTQTGIGCIVCMACIACMSEMPVWEAS